MSTFRAIVQDGHLVVEGTVPLPDGTHLELTVADPGDSLSAEERARLHQDLRAAWESAKTGRLRPASELIDALKRAR